MHCDKPRPSTIYFKVKENVKRSITERRGFSNGRLISRKLVSTRTFPYAKRNILTEANEKHNLFYDNLKEFTSSTTLHGFHYLLNKDYSIIERVWWLLMIICSVVSCSFLITATWNKWNDTPVVLKIADISTSVWDVPFPAVTLCSETKPRQRVFNYTKAYYQFRTIPPSISEEDLKLYYDMLLVCKNPESLGPDFADVSSIETIRRLAPLRQAQFFKCRWQNFSCDQMFYHTFTKDGYCFTFNMFSNEEMFRLENLHKDYLHVSGHNKSSWTLENGYSDDVPINTYPLRSLSYSGGEFQVVLLTDLRDLDPICRGYIQGFKVWLHNPAELPHMKQHFFRLPIKYHVNVAISPVLIDTAKTLRAYSPMKRRCFFADERYLKFFRTYTELNCDVECAANYTAVRCGCVPLYMPHTIVGGPNVKICGGGKAKCISEAQEELSYMKSGLALGDKNNFATKCNCLQACTSLVYKAEVSLAVYDVTLHMDEIDLVITSKKILPSGMSMYFSNTKFTSITRTNLYGTIEFLANCGGILSFFIGFSVLSFVEIIYYFTLRLWCRLRRG